MVFVALGLLFVGVALHATFDYASLARRSPAANSVAGVAATASTAHSAVESIDEVSPVFEQVEAFPGLARSPFATIVVQFTILLIAAVLILRLVVWQANSEE